MDVGEGIDHLHEAPQGDHLGEIMRRDEYHRENRCDLGVTGGEPAQNSLPPHNSPKILKYAVVSLVENAEFDQLAAIDCNALRVLPKAHQAETEVGLMALAIAVQCHKRPADFDRNPGADSSVEQSRPDQKAGETYRSHGS